MHTSHSEDNIPRAECNTAKIDNHCHQKYPLIPGGPCFVRVGNVGIKTSRFSSCEKKSTSVGEYKLLYRLMMSESQKNPCYSRHLQVFVIRKATPTKKNINTATKTKYSGKNETLYRSLMISFVGKHILLLPRGE